MDKGFTKVPNILLNNVMSGQFTGVQMKLIMAIWRYTNGFSRKCAELSLSFLADEIGSCQKVVSRQIKKLIEMNVVSVSYVNSSTRVRALMINDDTKSWLTGSGDGESTGAARQNATGTTAADGIAEGDTQDGNPQVDKPDVDNSARDNLSTNGWIAPPTPKRSSSSTRKWNNKYSNINTYINIKDRVNLSPELEKGFIKWLEYKEEYKEFYGKYSMIALAETVAKRAETYCVEHVLELIDDCIAAAYKNIVWERLTNRHVFKYSQEKKTDSFSDSFINDYDLSELEKLSRDTDNKDNKNEYD